MSATLLSPTQPATTPGRPALTRYLNTYWLRPENAFWMTLRSQALSKISFSGPTIDVSCGDGLFTFLHAGGDLELDFDVFLAAGNLDRVHRQHADMFDVPPDHYAPPIARTPAAPWDCGCDLKPNLLAKAEALGFYRRLVRHDNNATPLPFRDGEFGGVYCNSAYWVTAIDPFLAELGRITAADGLIVLHVKLADMARYTLQPFRAALGDRFLDLIGRGRLQCWPTVCSRMDWERRFQAAGLDVIAATPFVTRTHAQIWDVGLRPIAPLLTRMAAALTPDTRAAIKRDWVALFEELLAPLARPDFELLPVDAPAELQYVLRKR